MRVPLSQVAGMATYIAKNKLRPRPEWQKNLAAEDDENNPFRIVHTQIPSARARTQAASDDQQALPAGDDAGAAARLQSHLHRLRAHPRIRIQHPRAADAGAMPEGGGRVRRADGLDLRRRAAAVSRNRRNCARRSWRAASTSSSAPTACSWPRS